MTALFVKGLAFGFVLAATVGPMWMLCFRRTVASGALAGFVSGMGIAVADGIYGAIAAFGLTAISDLLLGQRLWLGLLGGVFLVYLGLRALLAAPAVPALLAFFLLPTKDEKIRSMKYIALAFLLGNLFFGIFNEYRIWFEMIPFALYAIDKHLLQEGAG